MSILMTACSPMRNQSLDHARLAYQQARRDPAIRAYAPITLQESAVALGQAERLWQNQGHWHHVHQFAALAERKAEAARMLARAKMAEANAQPLRADRTERQAIQQVRAYEPEHGPQEIPTRPLDLAPTDVPSPSVPVHAQQPMLAAFDPRETRHGLVLTVGDTLFELDQAELKPGAMRLLHPLLTFLKEHSTRHLLIAGGADSVGLELDRRDLAQRRAEEVRDFLVVNGIEPVRMTVRGESDVDTVAAHDTEATRPQSPRVEVIILGEGEWTSR